jgi:small-conductance mechanosensitive channel
MRYRFLADTVTVVHIVFVAFVLLGGFFALRWRRVAWLHGPAALWGVLMEWAGWVCPLTPLENWLRLKGQGQGYGGGFVEHYLVPVLYPAALSTGIQFVLGALVIAVNILIYGYVIQARRRRARSPG